MSITQAKAYKPFRKGTKVYLVNVLNLKFPSFIKATIDGQNEDKSFKFIFEDKVRDTMLTNTFVIDHLCEPPLLINGLSREDEIGVREDAHEARMIRATSLIQHKLVLSPQFLTDTTNNISEHLSYPTEEKRKMIIQELYNNMNDKIKKVNDRSIENRILAKPPPIPQPSLPVNTYPIEKGLYQKLVDYATNKTNKINQCATLDNEIIPPYYRRENNDIIYEFLNYAENLKNQPIPPPAPIQQQNYKTDKDDQSLQQTVYNKEFADKLGTMYRYFAQQTANNPETASLPRNIIINREQATTPLTTKTTTGNVQAATDTSTIDRPRRQTRQELNYEEDQFIDFSLEATVPLPLPTQENLKELAKQIRKSEFGQLETIVDLKHPIEVIIAYTTYILYIIGKGTSSNVKLERPKDTWITSFKARHHIINGFYAAYNIYKKVDKEGTKNVHMTDVENGFVALLSLIRATAYGISDQTFLSKISGEPQKEGKWKELYKRFVGIPPIQEIEYFIIRNLNGDEGGEFTRVDGEFGPKWKLPEKFLQCLKNEKGMFEALNAIPPDVKVVEPIVEEDNIDKCRTSIIKWDRYKTVPKTKKRKGKKTDSEQSETQQISKRTRSGEQQQESVAYYDLQGEPEEQDGEDNEDPDRSTGSVKTLLNLQDNDSDDNDDEQVVAEQLVRQAASARFNRILDDDEKAEL